MSTTPDTLWYSRSPVVSALAVAVRTGRLQQAFADSGVRLDSTTDHADPAIRRAYFDHHLPWSFRQGGSLPALWARSHGADTRLIGLGWNREFQALVTLPGTGIRSARELTGRRFGVPHFASPLGVDLTAPFALKGLLSARAAEGLDADGVELVHLALPARDPAAPHPLGRFGAGTAFHAAEAAALVRGEIDAFYVKGVEGVALANAIGASIVSEFGNHPDPWVRLGAGNPRPLTIGTVVARERPDLVALLLRTLGEIAPWATAHHDAAVTAIAEDHRASTAAVRAALGVDIGSHLGLTLRDEDLELLARYKQRLLEWKILQHDFALEDWVLRA